MSTSVKISNISRLVRLLYLLDKYRDDLEKLNIITKETHTLIRFTYFIPKDLQTSNTSSAKSKTPNAVNKHNGNVINAFYTNITLLINNMMNLR